LECVEKLCYLGNLIGAGGGGAEEESRATVRCAWAKFRKLAAVLTSRYIEYSECLGICKSNLGYESGGYGTVGENGTKMVRCDRTRCSFEEHITAELNSGLGMD